MAFCCEFQPKRPYHLTVLQSEKSLAMTLSLFWVFLDLSFDTQMYIFSTLSSSFSSTSATTKNAQPKFDHSAFL